MRGGSTSSTANAPTFAFGKSLFCGHEVEDLRKNAVEMLQGADLQPRRWKGGYNTEAASLRTGGGDNHNDRCRKLINYAITLHFTPQNKTRSSAGAGEVSFPIPPFGVARWGAERRHDVNDAARP